MNSLANKISAIMSHKNMNAVDIEKSTGLNKNTVYSIISGTSKNPSANNLHLIAKALGVSLDSILPTENEVIVQPLSIKEMEVFSAVTVTTVKILIEKNIDITMDKLINLIKEIYQYSTKTEPANVEERFIHWIIDKNKL